VGAGGFGNTPNAADPEFKQGMRATGFRPGQVGLSHLQPEYLALGNNTNTIMSSNCFLFPFTSEMQPRGHETQNFHALIGSSAACHPDFSRGKLLQLRRLPTPAATASASQAVTS
jgi:hypothetical protein